MRCVKDHKLGTPNKQVLDVNIANGGYKISVVVVHGSPGSALARDLKLSFFSRGFKACGQSYHIRSISAPLRYILGVGGSHRRRLLASVAKAHKREWYGSTRYPSESETIIPCIFRP